VIVRLTRIGFAEKMRLFCFPCAGGSSANFRSWPNYVPPDVGVYSVDLPGRLGRSGEEPYRELDALVTDLVKGITGFLDRPFIVYGHSLGARIALAITERLTAKWRVSPLLLAVAASLPPEKCPGRDPSKMTDGEFFEHLAKLGGTPREVLANRELMTLLTPCLRADFNLAQQIVVPSGRLHVPVVVFGGLADPTVTRADLEAWRAVTKGPFQIQMFPNDHFFPHETERLIVHQLLSLAQGVANHQMP
jgi:surfactin synthase thioesterase subunit